MQMKVVVQSKTNAEFYGGRRHWVSDIDEAHDFGSFVHALDFCLDEHLGDTFIRLHTDSGSCYELYLQGPRRFH